MADALENQPVYIEPEDRLIGRVYHLNTKKAEEPGISVPLTVEERLSLPEGRLFSEKYPDYREWLRYQLVPGVAVGHIAWDWNELLKTDTAGMKKQCADRVGRTKTPKASRFTTASA